MDDNILLVVVFLVFCYFAYKFRKQIFSKKILGIFDQDTDEVPIRKNKKKRHVVIPDNKKTFLSDDDSQQLGSLVSENN